MWGKGTSQGWVLGNTDLSFLLHLSSPWEEFHIHHVSLLSLPFPVSQSRFSSKTDRHKHTIMIHFLHPSFAPSVNQRALAIWISTRRTNRTFTWKSGVDQQRLWCQQSLADCVTLFSQLISLSLSLFTCKMGVISLCLIDSVIFNMQSPWLKAQNITEWSIHELSYPNYT